MTAPTDPLWVAVDHGRDATAYLVAGDHPGSLLLIVEAEHANLAVALPDAALRRGALAVGRYLITRSRVGPIRADQLRADLLDLTSGLGDGPTL